LSASESSTKLTAFYHFLQVSGDNPVYVESVKPGGAAQIAGLVANDMILKVCFPL